MYKIKGKRILAAILSALLLTTGIQMPAAAATDGGEASYSATPSDAVPELDEDLETVPDEDEIVIMPATPADAADKPANNIQPMILDIAAPEVNSARLLTTEVSVPGQLTLELDIVEEGYGASVILAISGRDMVASAVLAQPLFTGTSIVDLQLEPRLEEREYEIDRLIIADSRNQNSYYNYELSGTEWPFTGETVFNVISSVYPRADFILEKVSFQNPALQVSESLKADLTVGNIGNGINRVSMFFYRNGDRYDLWSASYNQNLSGKIQNGKNTITVDTSYFAEGTYELAYIRMDGTDGFVIYEDDIQSGLFGDLKIVVTGQLDPEPEITGVRIKNTTIQAPGTLDIEMDIIAGNGGVDEIYLYLLSPGVNRVETKVSLPSAPGDLGEVTNPDQQVIRTGTYTFRFPIPSDMYPGIEYDIDEIVIVDRAEELNFYEKRYGAYWPFDLPAVRIMRADYELETSVLHPNLPEMLAAIPNGSKVLLDGSTSEIIPRAVFTALVGKDITVSVERYDSLSGLYGLYTFNGRDISTAAIRSVPIKFSFAYAAGADYGIADETVYLLQFEGSGRLPCPITFRITVSSLLHAENSYDSGTMYVSRLSGTSLVWDRTVSESADGLTELSFTNYSDYILSRTKPVYKSSGSGSGGSSSSTSAGTWIKDETGWWYRYHNGTYPKTEWKYINGSWYYFEDTGYMATGWKLLDGKWYWLDPGSGKMLADNWLSDRGSWYYLGGDGAMATGWQNYQNAYYFLSQVPGESYGSMLRDGITPDGYHVNQDGVWVP